MRLKSAGFRIQLSQPVLTQIVQLHFVVVPGTLRSVVKLYRMDPQWHPASYSRRPAGIILVWLCGCEDVVVDIFWRTLSDACFECLGANFSGTT